MFPDLWLGKTMSLEIGWKMKRQKFPAVFQMQVSLIKTGYYCKWACWYLLLAEFDVTLFIDYTKRISTKPIRRVFIFVALSVFQMQIHFQKKILQTEYHTVISYLWALARQWRIMVFVKNTQHIIIILITICRSVALQKNFSWHAVDSIDCKWEFSHIA